ncbi:alpha/beta fold hydrolase [Agrococcus sp. SGAir0287]|uniref:alpha/beta fold hydrolase n=1 Tax=Agrococcus sp. SGAir0287 TaxID=2070347 RepID=UPI0020C81360|nr:alpha/beta fold hydrolase [Agrococcus sp. SGAir0287]
MTAPAAHPPAGLPGLDPRWSRIVEVDGRGLDAGVVRGWHCLDTAAVLEEARAPIVGTILAVHGNPTWSYLWRSLAASTVAAAQGGAPAWRVVAVDQLDMGWSERTGVHRPLAQRVADLAAFTDAIGLAGPVVTIGHDWGGVVSMGWAVDHPESLAGLALLNTAIHHPAGVPIPAPLRLASARGMLAASTVRTTAFLDTTLALASPALAPDVRAAYRAPYATAARRGGIGGFVADIPADERHASRAELDRIAAGVAALTVPALMLWGPRDPIFGDRYLDDLVDRLPHADVHRFEGAGHLVAEERPYADAVLTWLGERLPDGEVRTADGAAADEPVPDAPAFVPIWAGLDARADDDDVAVVDMAVRAGQPPREVSWRRLGERVRGIAAGLSRLGVRRGDRVSLLVPPGPTLTAALYACLRIGAVVVVADAGLGVRGLTRAVRGAWPDVIIGETPGLAAARALGWPGMRISARRLPAAARAALGVERSLGEVAAVGADAPLPEPPGADDEAAILFTSGSTGPAKGVVYRHGQLAALRDVLAAHFAITRDTGLVTGFAPFALLGPALGTRSATPDMDVSSPRTLTASAVAAAVRASDGRIVFLSPAAILNVVATADALTTDDRAVLARVETFLSTGAPVAPSLLAAAQALMPNATPHTPYGMTECLLVTDVTLAGIEDAASAADAGVCVGRPIGSNRVLVAALDASGSASGEPSAEPGVLGEIVVSAPHLKQGYDRLALIDRDAVRGTPSDPLRDERASAHPLTDERASAHPLTDERASAHPLPDEGASAHPLPDERASAHPLPDERASAHPLPDERASAHPLPDERASAHPLLEERAQRASRKEPTDPHSRWHRTGDVGHLDAEGHLWIEGRLPHVLVTADGPVAPVGAEQDVERVEAVRRAAVVGVGPRGLHQAVAVVETVEGARATGLADVALAAHVRASTRLPLVAVLVVPALPTDIRHNSKIDRARLSAWADRLLAGERAGAP